MMKLKEKCRTMLIFRVIIILVAITAMVLLACYYMFDEEKYLRYFKRTLKYGVFLMLSVVILFALRRILYL
jgi:branched-subunit amino acid transport protein AzlD